MSDYFQLKHWPAFAPSVKTIKGVLKDHRKISTAGTNELLYYLYKKVILNFDDLFPDAFDTNGIFVMFPQVMKNLIEHRMDTIDDFQHHCFRLTSHKNKPKKLQDEDYIGYHESRIKTTANILLRDMYAALKGVNDRFRDFVGKYPNYKPHLCTSCIRPYNHDLVASINPVWEGIYDKIIDKYGEDSHAAQRCSLCLKGTYVVVCECCGKLFLPNRTYTASSYDTRYSSRAFAEDHFCDECRPLQVQCVRCNTYITNPFDMDGKKYCEDCFNLYNRPCTQCGKEFNAITRKREPESHYCDKCVFEQMDYASYNYHPSEWIIKHMPGEKVNRTLCFGMEIEMEPQPRRSRVFVDGAEFDEDVIIYNVIKRLKENLTHEDVYFVSDGSLSGGVEMPTLPFTNLWYLNNRPWFEELWDLILKSGGSCKGSNCGLHIHTNIEAWTRTQIFKMIKILYPGNANTFFSQLYGRRDNSFCRRDGDQYNRSVKVAKDKRNINNSSHYHMINMTKNTIEFRMFNGTDNVNDVFGYLDFLRALHEYTLYNGLRKMDYRKLANFIIHSGNKFKYAMQKIK